MPRLAADSERCGRQRQGVTTPCHYQRIAERGACGKAPVVPHTARPCLGKQGRDERRCHCRGRADGPDAGRGAGIGGGRCRDRRAASDVGAGGVAGGRVPLAHHRGPRPAGDRRPVPRRGKDRPGRDVRQHGAGPQRLPDAGIPTRSGSSRTTSSGSCSAGSRSWACRSIAGSRSIGFAQDDTGVDLHLADGESLRAAYLVGADGGRSVIRTAAGIEFVGCGGDAEQPDRRGRGDRGDAEGVHASTPRAFMDCT